ncbi:peptidoglycan-recognition protein LF-like [Macrosteles quadrilineatus]|uniref:peptidoglycan-recognition protein LF-like n=1 Tax=Macrosteles quadrilineatus TaxID=74068 RepID=UPI0023E1B67D|nr:peptidoglycan-recognition protein LF-like [Macrosteles quadrilineatus]
MPLKLVTRKEWGATKPFYQDPQTLPVPWIVIKYYTRSPFCHCVEDCCNIVNTLQKNHMKLLGYMDIKYNFLVGGDGCVYEGRGWYNTPTKQDMRLLDFYTESYDIALIGDYQDINPPEEMMQAVKCLADYGVNAGFLKPDYKVFENRKDTVMPYDPEHERYYGKEGLFENTPYN